MKIRNHPPSFLIIGIALLALSGCSSRGYRPVAVVPPPPLPSPPALVQDLPLRNVTLPTVLTGLRQPRFDVVEEIIEKAEASFEKGTKDYHAGHLGVAKKEFNAAIEGILQAPVNLRDDRRLSKTFDSLVDRIHAYELEALRQGDGFTEPAYQPAPLDELQSLTFPDNPAAPGTRPSGCRQYRFRYSPGRERPGSEFH